ncbi:hypothetical protein ACFC8N_40790 [Streptomyces sp. NPDC055966]|uniref:hypothetical protein n=1 Tax=Streptomyces sp. NPDC055966 TaxID=3345669 RepID=UPI0035DA91CB
MASPPAQPELDLALQAAAALVAVPDASTAVFQARVGLAALDLAREETSLHVTQLQEAVADMAVLTEAVDKAEFALRDLL